MASCVYPNSSGFLQVISGTNFESCAQDTYVILQKKDYIALIESQTDWAYYLDFDNELFDTLLTFSLTTFIIGHSLGRIIKAFGKV